jgi:hypothetical protein
MTNRHEVDIIVANEPLDNYHYNDEERRAVVPPLRSPLDMGTFLHELGHADQYHDNRFAKVTPLYSVGKSFGVHRGVIRETSTARRAVDKAIEAAPEAADIMSEAEREEIYARLDVFSKKRKENIDLSMKLDRKKTGLLKEKDVALREFVAGSFNVLSPGELLREIEATRDAVDASANPGAHKAAAEEFISKLEMAGFRFNPEKRPPPAPPRTPEVNSRIFKIGGKPKEEVLPQVYAEDVADIHVIKSLIERVADKLKLDETEINFLGNDTMRIKFHAPVAGEMRAVVLELGVPPGARADYEQKLAGKDFEIEEIIRKRSEVDAETEAIEKDFSAELDKSGLRDIIALPTRKMERDATARAFLWARRIRDRAGLDLFKKLAIPSAVEDEDTCEGSVAAGVKKRWSKKKSITTDEDLMGAAETYDAARIPHRSRKKT